MSFIVTVYIFWVEEQVILECYTHERWKKVQRRPTEPLVGVQVALFVYLYSLCIANSLRKLYYAENDRSSLNIFSYIYRIHQTNISLEAFSFLFYDFSFLYLSLLFYPFSVSLCCHSISSSSPSSPPCYHPFPTTTFMSLVFLLVLSFLISPPHHQCRLLSPSSSVLSSISLFHVKLFLPFCSLLSTHFWQDVCLLTLFISADFFTSTSARSDYILQPSRYNYPS